MKKLYVMKKKIVKERNFNIEFEKRLGSYKNLFCSYNGNSNKPTLCERFSVMIKGVYKEEI